MIEQLGRDITYLRISLTDKCNLRCRYCMPAEGVCKRTHQEMMNEDEVVAAVEVAAALGIRKIRLTGGEPLVKKNIAVLSMTGLSDECIAAMNCVSLGYARMVIRTLRDDFPEIFTEM